VKKPSIYKVYSSCYLTVVGEAIVQRFQNGEKFSNKTTTTATASAAYVERLGKGLSQLSYSPSKMKTLRVYCSILANQKGITDGPFNVKVKLAGSIAKYVPSREELAIWSVGK
jgi:hypothetical protein